MTDAEDAPRQAAALAETMLDEETARREASVREEVLFADELLPGVGSEAITLKQGLAMGGGATTFVVLLVLNSLDELQASAFAILGPDIGGAQGKLAGLGLRHDGAAAAPSPSPSPSDGTPAPA